MTRKKSLIIAIVLVLVTVAVVLILRSYIFNQIEVKLKEAFQSLTEKGLSIKYDSLSVSWSKNEIHVFGLMISKTSYDTACVPSELKTKGVHIHGVNLLKLVALQKFSIDQIFIDSLDLKLVRGTKLFQDSSTSKKPFFIKTASIIFKGAKIQFIDSLCQVEYSVESSLTLSDLNIEAEPEKPFIASVESVKMTNNKAVLPKSNYTVTVAEIRANLLKGIMAIDTIRLIPHLSELAFGRNAGHDIDRIDGSIPFLHFSGIEYQFIDTLAFRVSKVDLQFFLKIFHDKRLPHKNIYKPLPLQQLQSLGFGLIIDTVEIKKSYVAYEEFAEDAEEPGMVYFDNIAGHIHNVNNDGALQEGRTMMEARANFMGDGLLSVRTIFPYKSTENCHLEGSLTNFSFEKVNPMLSPATNLRFESGKINSLSFAFDYNNTRSDGSIDLNYEGLKLVSLKEDKKVTKAERRRRKKQNLRPDLKKDNLKTFIINTFVLKKNMDDRLPAEKRTGTVLFYRDTTRSTFNYWWKSLSSGLKSAFHLDKPAAK